MMEDSKKSHPIFIGHYNGRDTTFLVV